MKRIPGISQTEWVIPLHGRADPSNSTGIWKHLIQAIPKAIWNNLIQAIRIECLNLSNAIRQKVRLEAIWRQTGDYFFHV